MRFMVLMIPGVYRNNKEQDPNFAPTAENMEPMMNFNKELQKHMKIIALDGLKPLTTGARIEFSGAQPKVTDGPFIETKEVFGGYWMLEAESKEQVLEWMKKCPAEKGDIIEIRQVFEMSDFPLQVREKMTIKESLQ